MKTILITLLVIYLLGAIFAAFFLKIANAVIHGSNIKIWNKAKLEKRVQMSYKQVMTLRSFVWFIWLPMWFYFFGKLYFYNIKKKPFHKLTKEQYQVLISEKQTWSQIQEKYRGPMWCSYEYPGPLQGDMGCWTLCRRDFDKPFTFKDCKNCSANIFSKNYGTE